MPTICGQRELDGSTRAGLYIFGGELAGVDAETDYAHDDAKRVGSAELDLGYEFTRNGKPVEYTVTGAAQRIGR